MLGRCQLSMKISGGHLHGARKRKNRKREILPGHFHNKRKQALLKRISARTKISNKPQIWHNHLSFRLTQMISRALNYQILSTIQVVFQTSNTHNCLAVICIIILYHWSGPHHLKSSFCVWEGEQVWGHLRKHSICLRPWRPGYGGCVKILWTLPLLLSFAGEDQYFTNHLNLARLLSSGSSSTTRVVQENNSYIEPKGTILNMNYQLSLVYCSNAFHITDLTSATT